MRARLDQRRAELAAEHASHTTFKPAIDPSPSSCCRGGLPTPPHVFDRLYASAFNFADLREAAVQV